MLPWTERDSVARHLGQAPPASRHAGAWPRRGPGTLRWSLARHSVQLRRALSMEQVLPTPLPAPVQAMLCQPQCCLSPQVIPGRLPEGMGEAFPGSILDPGLVAPILSAEPRGLSRTLWAPASPCPPAAPVPQLGRPQQPPVRRLRTPPGRDDVFAHNTSRLVPIRLTPVTPDSMTTPRWTSEVPGHAARRAGPVLATLALLPTAGPGPAAAGWAVKRHRP